MRTLVARQDCSASPADAWYALRGFRWSVPAREVAAYDANEVGQEQRVGVGGRPTELIYGALELRCRIVALEHERRMSVSVRWRRVLNAVFTFEIVPAEEGCNLVHTRLYRGLVTRYLAALWRAREEEEQAAVLRDWCWEAGSIAAQRRWAS
jgi:hypothetical protein